MEPTQEQEPTQEREPETAERAACAGAEGRSELVEEDLVVEEVSIDGMCGVY